MNNEEKKVTIINKIEPRWENVILIGIWLTGIFVFFLFIVYGFILEPDKISIGSELILFFIPFILVGIKFFQILLWNARGVEQISIDSQELKVERLGTVLCPPKVFNLLDIKNIHTTDNDPYSLFSKYNWNTNEGKVAFKYMYQNEQMGVELNIVDAEDLVEVLKEKTAQAKKANGITE